MAQNPLSPKDNGRIRMPVTDNAMNKIAPRFNIDDKGNALGYPAPDPEDKEKILARVRKNMERAISASSENRKSALDDRLFRVGQQWPTEVMAQRNLDKRPCLTINKLPTFIYQIVNNQRQNRPAVNVSPVGDRSDPGVAKMYRGMIRHIERKSHADLAYDTAYDDAVTGGWGWFRVITDWESPKSFNQMLKVVRVRNPFTVYEDPSHQDPTGRDMKWCFITDMMTRDEFKEMYPDAVQMPYSDSGIGEKVNSWITKDEIRVAEYFELQYETRELVRLSNGHIGWRDELDDLVRMRMKRGSIQLLEERESRVPKVMWYKVTAVDILDQEEWIGSTIPLIKVSRGERSRYRGQRTMLSGIVRNAKDPQRMLNYWATSKTEIIALQPKAPWVMEEGQGEGHEDEFKNSNVKNIPVLYYKGTNIAGTPAPPPQRQPMAGIPAGIMAAEQGASQDLMSVVGIRFDPGANDSRIDESGKALHEVRRTGDIGAYHYLDNLSRSLQRCGEIMIECIPILYNEARVVTILREDDTEEQVKLDPNLPTPTGKENRPWAGKVKVLATVQPDVRRIRGNGDDRAVLCDEADRGVRVDDGLYEGAAADGGSVCGSFCTGSGLARSGADRRTTGQDHSSEHHGYGRRP